MKKGFTLVELMATIVILSVISMIGVGVYQKAQKNIKEQEYKNKIIYIETQAALFASETGYMSTNVDYLVKTGYVEADNDNGEVISPLDKKILNYHVVIITKEGDNYYGHFTDKEESDLSNIDMTNENLEIIATTESGRVLENNEWTNENVILSTNIKKENMDTNTITKIKWYNNVNVKEIEVDKNYNQVNSYKIEVSQILDAEFKVEIIFEDGSKFDARRTIKVDKQKPILYEQEVKVEKANVWTNTAKKVDFLSTDQNGSGIYGYFISDNPIIQCSTTKEEYTESGEVFSAEKYQGTYYVCVMDKAGNASQAISMKVEKTDVNPPTIGYFIEEELQSYANSAFYKYVKLKSQALDNGSSNESGIKQINYCISTNGEKCTPKSTVKLSAGNFAYYEINKDNNNKQMVCTVAQDAAGNTSDVHCSNQYWVKKNLTVADAGTMCNPDAYHYCNLGTYIKYGNYTFTLYKAADNSVYGYTYVGEMPLIDTFCCDQGVCHSDYVYNDSVGIYKSLKEFYAKLPSSRLSILNKENYSFGYVTKSNFTQGATPPAINTDRHEIKEFSLKDFPETINQGYTYGLPSEFLNDVICEIDNFEYKRIEGDDFELGNYKVTCRKITEDSFSDEEESIEKEFTVVENPDFNSDSGIIEEGTAYGTHYITYYPTTTRLTTYGLFDMGEYQIVREKSYGKNLATLVSTVVDAVVYSSGNSGNWNASFGHDGVNSDISAIYVTPSQYYAVTPMQYGKKPTNMTVPFNKNVTIKSGSGSLADPFVIE